MAFSIKTLAEDLLTLEVNTIVTADMTCAKMPSCRREAFWQIATAYHLKLMELKCREPVIWQGAGLMAFWELQERAKKGIVDRAAEMDKLTDVAARQTVKEQQVMLARIHAQSAQVVSLYVELARAVDSGFDVHNYREKMAAAAAAPDFKGYDKSNAQWNNDVPRNMLQQLDELKLDAAQITLLRKIKEIGTARVMLQTVIHADGDVTTRIAERLVYKPNQTLFNLHNQSVDHAVSFWTGLVELITKLAGSLFTGGKATFSDKAK
ncbi:MAG: hypothetical protein GY862_11695 [Gammaproteobacteria bacterium]|nr:hypothetical protein [Gammaproteobacteria bacterium]